jgi:transcriptional regulator with XRE-family HTH domain
MSFASELQAAREVATLSQSAAALAIGRSVRTLQNWERGANTPHATIQAAALRKLKKARSRKGQNDELSHGALAPLRSASGSSRLPTTSEE